MAANDGPSTRPAAYPGTHGPRRPERGIQANAGRSAGLDGSTVEPFAGARTGWTLGAAALDRTLANPDADADAGSP